MKTVHPLLESEQAESSDEGLWLWEDVFSKALAEMLVWLTRGKESFA